MLAPRETAQNSTEKRPDLYQQLLRLAKLFPSRDFEDEWSSIKEMLGFIKNIFTVPFV